MAVNGVLPRRRVSSSSKLVRLHPSILVFITSIAVDTRHEIFSALHFCHAYSFPSMRPRFNANLFGFGAGGVGGDPPRNHIFLRFGGFDGDGDRNYFGVASALLVFPVSDSSDETVYYHQQNKTLSNEDVVTSDSHLILRGGGGIKARTGNLFKRLPFSKSTEKSQSTSAQQEQVLSTTKVTSVTAPTSEILPAEVITQFAENSQLIGDTLTPETLDSTASSINNWYATQGYVMNSVTGATLVPDKECKGQGHVELKVREAKLSKSRINSVIIRFVEPTCDASDKDESGDVIKVPIQNNSPEQSQSADEAQQYQQYRTTSGRTRPLKVAKLVGMAPGSHFRIIPQRWSRIVASPGGILAGVPNSGRIGPKSAIFSTIHAVRPVPTGEDDNTVSLEIIATENKPYVSLEYGVTKSLYSDQWEGEFDLKHANAFGGGEVASLNIRKGGSTGNSSECHQDGHSTLEDWNKKVKNGPLSWRMSITDDSLGGGGAGYDLEVFRDHVGLARDGDTSSNTSPLRTGSSMRLRLPQYSIPHAVSASLEQIDPTPGVASSASTQSASISMNMGPINFLRSGLTALVTAGVQRDIGTNRISQAVDDSSSSNQEANVRPYFSGMITSQQIVPLCQLPFTSRGSSKSFVDLAIRHVASVSTKYLPRHEAIMLGLSSRVRGYKYNYQSGSVWQDPPQHTKRRWASLLKLNSTGKVRPPIAISNSICGNVELRLPFRPLSNKDIADRNLKSLPTMLAGTLVVFGDWAISQGQAESLSISTEKQVATPRPFRQSSVGIGYHTVVQGIPLKVDACITEHGTGGLFFGIGHDFGA